ncbi:TPA: putative holin-like toxin [Streptococcus suis]|nr:putative holin-like toxin [Streptococcus suis]NQO22035.1 putative holin-like toxin [Streptococcus suis]NQP15211.1 putative holin-like toxin [Streptococcus suis]HEL2422499.1 putative holin-like toxin [Streptococcus suis]HEM5120984.1 putative holin-like toxin [Streptococcus suis]
MKNIVSKIKRRGLISAFEVVQTILAFGSFTIFLISLCYKIFKENDKNNPSPLLTELLDEL